ncbi:HXXXD-type acyl-transferase family protein [Rhynchospora pubera]|uniref:HXXXD-type acyl-transferase family protein n=1 Tax=Rhynchospora pubera TaxID=906938 RepID=A0AAV8FQI6_9POAL|nr:HXXXD-type acyl-transferase family protein [Rhynchospora pubera]
MAPEMASSPIDSSSSPLVTILSKRTILPDSPSAMPDLKLSVSDLPMLSCHYIQKGLFFPKPNIPMSSLVSLLVSSLSRALTIIPAFAGRFTTYPDGRIFISCNDAGVDFYHATAPRLSLASLLPPSSDVPKPINNLFPMDSTISYQGHFHPLAAFQLTELGDGAIFIGCAVSHALVDGTSFWHFFNTWAELCRGGSPKLPDFRRNYFGNSKAVLRFASSAGPEVTFPVDAPVRERIFHFSADAVRLLKSKANRYQNSPKLSLIPGQEAEICGKQIHDLRTNTKGSEISSFQSLCALIWQAVTRARKWLPSNYMTTFRMAVNCRHRIEPRVSPMYFGNAIQSTPTRAKVDEVTGKDLRWVAGLLHASVLAHGDAAIRQVITDWEAAPKCFPLGNPDGTVINMGSSNRFPMYEGNDFGWGRPLAVRSGKANKFDGKMSAFPGREGDGSVDIEMCLAPETMAALLLDEEFMGFVSD